MPLESKDYLLNCFSQRPLFWEGLTSSTYPGKNIILIVFDMHIKMFMCIWPHAYTYMNIYKEREIEAWTPATLDFCLS